MIGFRLAVLSNRKALTWVVFHPYAFYPLACLLLAVTRPRLWPNVRVLLWIDLIGLLNAFRTRLLSLMYSTFPTDQHDYEIYGS